MWLPSMFNLPKNIFQLADKSKIMVTIVLLHNNLVKQLEIKDEVTKKLSISSMMMRVISLSQYWSVWLMSVILPSVIINIGDLRIIENNKLRKTFNKRYKTIANPKQ